MTSLLLLVIASLLLGSSSDECARSSVVVAPSSGPTVCLPLDDYIQLRQEAAASVSDGKTGNASAPSVESVSSPLLLYRYMSPLWLQTHANFTETPSSVSAQNMDFPAIASGITYPTLNVLFKVNLIDAGVLHDDKAYAIQLGLFLKFPAGDSDPIFQICDGNYCMGLWIWNQNRVRAYSGNDLVSHCVMVEQGDPISAPQTSSNWNIRLEIHPNSTNGIAYVSTASLTLEYSENLKPSRGLHFKVCRDHDNERFQFNLFELAVYSV